MEIGFAKGFLATPQGTFSGKVPGSLRIPLLWCTVILFAATGLSPLISAPVVADDLQILLEGASRKWSGWSFFDLVAALTNSMVGGAHVLPAAGLATSAHVEVVIALSEAGVPLRESWGLLRVAWIITALLACSWAYKSWLQVARGLVGAERFSLLPSFALISALSVATIQVHALWANDPVVSYPVAAWLTAALSFAFLGAIACLWRARPKRVAAWCAIASAIGVFGVLQYEMAIAAIATGAVAVLGLYLVFRKERNSGLRLLFGLISVLLPTAVFLATQIARWGYQNSYDGTTAGYKAWFLPVLLNGWAGQLPLTNTALTLKSVQLPQPSNWHVTLVVVSISVLILVWWRSRPSRQEQTRRGASAWILYAIAVAFLSVLVVAPFAASQKYQEEIGTTLGRTYLFFSVGMLCFASITAMTIEALLTRTVKFTMGVLALVVVVGGAQSLVNSVGLVELSRRAVWSTSLLTVLDNGAPPEIRCQVLSALIRPELPAFQEEAMIRDGSAAYEFKYGEPMCSEPAPR